MPNPFPSEEYRKFCCDPENAWLQELWEPRTGDACWDGRLVGYIELSIQGEPWIYAYHKHKRRKDVVWLPRPDQLWEMLEERGIEWKLLGNVARIRLPGQAWADAKLIVHRGPDPAIALAKCLREVIEKGGEKGGIQRRGRT